MKIVLGVLTVAGIVGGAYWASASAAEKWPAHVCKEIDSFSRELGRASDQPEERRTLMRMPLMKLWQEHCV